VNSKFDDAGGNLTVDRDRVTAATGDRFVLGLRGVLTDLAFRFAGDSANRTSGKVI
jgi:hypothetical protein